MRHAKFLVLAVGIMVACLAVPAYAVENSGIGGQPANPRADNPRTKSIFVHELQPGESVRDAVKVINNTAEDKIVQVYPVDSQTASGGAFACEQKADGLDREGSWIKLDKGEVKLGPSGSENIGFTITVPKGANVGEHNACIALQAVEPPSSSNTNGVQLSFRSAIRVAVTVPGELTKQLTYEKLTVTQKDGKIIVRQVLYNGGNVSLDTNLDTSIKTFIGTTAENKNGEYPILSGQSAEFNFEYKRPVWGGFYRVAAQASYNDDLASTLGESSGSTKKINSSTIFFVMPKPIYLAAYVLILAVVAGGVYYYLYRRKLLQKLAASAVAHKVVKGDTVTGLAKAYDMPWKQIVALNSLKKPYVLEVGSEIKVVPGPNHELAEIKLTSKTVKKSTVKPKTTAKKKPSKSKNSE